MKTIPLTRGKAAIVDDEDYEYLNGFKWRAVRGYNCFYATRINSRKGGSKYTVTWMHREIMRPTDGMQVDHINGDGLDNRRANLRIASSSQNAMNRGASKNNKLGVKGVSLFCSGYRAQICINRKVKHLGLFPSINEARAAYESAARKLHGEFSKV